MLEVMQRRFDHFKLGLSNLTSQAEKGLDEIGGHFKFGTVKFDIIKMLTILVESTTKCMHNFVLVCVI